MKRQIMKSLRALAIFVAASSLVVSCYDDSALRTEISGVKNDLKEVEARLDSLENDLSKQITAVQSLFAAADEKLESQIKVAEVKTNDNGKVTILLTDGTSFEVEPASKNTNPILTVKTDGNGNKYWAIVDPATGEASVIEVNDTPVPVAHPDFRIRFNDSSRSVEVSVNGGTSWVNTGIVIPEATVCGAIFTKVEDGEKEVTFWMGDESFTVSKVELVRFEIMAGKLYFDVEETKNVNVDLTGVKSAMLMKTPKGWTVDFDGTTLTVTSPTEDAIWYEMTAEQAGAIEIWAATEDERLIVGTLDVAIPEMSVPVAIVVGKSPAYEVEIIPGMDMMTYNMVNARFGVCKRSEFDADEILEKIEAADESVWSVMEAAYGGYATDEGTVKVSMAELLGSEPEAGVDYIVWSLPPTTEIDYEIYDYVETFSKEELIKVYVTPVFVDIEASEVSFNDMNLAVSVVGTDKYFAGYFPASEYDEDTFDIQLYFNSSPGVGYSGPKGMWAYYTEAYNGKLSNFASDYTNSINVDCEYLVFVVPMNKGDKTANYTNDDVVFKSVKTQNILPGGTATVALDEEASEFAYDEIIPQFTTDAALTFYRYYAVSETNTAEVIKAKADSSYVSEFIGIIKNGLASETDEEVYMSVETGFAAPKWSLMPASEFVLVTVAVDAEGKYVVNKFDLASLEIPYADEVSVEITDATGGVTTAALTLDIVGDYSQLAVYKYDVTNYEGAEVDAVVAEQAAKFRLNVANKYPSTDYYTTYVDAADITDGKYVYDGLALGKTYAIFVMGITEDGKFSDVVDTKVTTSLGDDAVVLATDSDYFKPEIGFDANRDGVIDGLYYSYDKKTSFSNTFAAGYTIMPNEKAAKVEAYSLYINNISNDAGDLLSGKALIEVLLTKTSRTYDPSQVNTYYLSSTWNYIGGTNENVLCVMWTDADGRYYEPVVLRTEQIQRSLYSVAEAKDYAFAGNPAPVDNGVTPTKYVYKNFTVAETSTFYFRENASDDVKWGLAAEGTLEAGVETALVQGADAKPFTVAAGTYNVSFDIVAKKVTFTSVN